MKAKVIIGHSEIDSDLYYATYFLAPDNFIYLEIGKRKIVYVNDMEFSRATGEIKCCEVFNVSSCPKKYKNALEWIVKENKIDEIIVSENLPIKYVETLRKLGVKIEIKVGDFFPERSEKNEKEIENIKKTQEVNGKGMSLVIEVIRKSKIKKDGKLEYKNKILTSEFLKEVVDIEFLKGKCRSEMNIISCGKLSAQPHSSGSGAIFANEPIVIDLFPRSMENRYYADMTRTVVKGKASEEIKKIYKTVLQGQKMAIENLKAGVKISSLEKEVRAYFEKIGYTTENVNGNSQGFIHSLGHGVGLDIHEKPSITQKNNKKLKVGNVITIEPGLYYPEIGGIRIEDMLLIKGEGYENLTNFPHFLEI